MFKHYLTYQFVLSFHQSCRALELQPTPKERLLRSAETLLHKFSTGLHARDPKEELKQFCVSLICLRECKEILRDAGFERQEIQGPLQVLEGRLEQLVGELADRVEGGQLRLFG